MEIKERTRERERNSKKDVVIWALYDDAECSYKKAIEKHLNSFDKFNIQVYSMGINNIRFKKNDRFHYHRIDLSLHNFNLINELKKLPKPNVILASPPCESWSGADCDGKMTREIRPDFTWIVKNKKYYEEYNKRCHPVKRRYFFNKERNRLNGESTIGATIEIILTFKPKVWVIENPKTSKTWDFQKNHLNFDGIMNSTYYSSYDKNFSLKPTIFKSNIKLNLRHTKSKTSNKNHMALGSYSRRSAIPNMLIKEILEQIFSYIRS